MSDSIFLAHASEDKPTAREIWERLHQRALNPWLDEKELVGGENWRVASHVLSSTQMRSTCSERNASP